MTDYEQRSVNNKEFLFCVKFLQHPFHQSSRLYILLLAGTHQQTVFNARAMNFSAPSTYVSVSAHMSGMTFVAQDVPILNLKTICRFLGHTYFEVDNLINLLHVTD